MSLVSINFQVPTPQGFQDIARTKLHRSRSLRQFQRSNQGQTMMLHTYTPGFETSAGPPVRDRQKCYWVEKIKNFPVCVS